MSTRDLTAIFDGSVCRLCGSAMLTNQCAQEHAAIHLAECTAIVVCTGGVERVMPNGRVRGRTDDPAAAGLTDDVDADVARRAVAEQYAHKHRGIRIPKGFRVFRP